MDTASSTPATPLAVRNARRFHYAWIVAAIAFLSVMLPAAIRGVLSILVVPLEIEFGWNRSVVSGAAALSMLLFGLLGPFVASVMQRVGIRRVMLWGLFLVAGTMIAAPLLTSPLMFVMVWGVGVGIGAGVLGMVMGATIINHWFLEGRGLAMGILSAAIATVQLIVLPPAAIIVRAYGWRSATVGIALFTFLLLIMTFRWMRDRPADVGALRYGELEPAPPPTEKRSTNPLTILGEAVRVPTFWLLAFPFFVCGLGTGGLIAVHLVPASIEHGIPEVQSALLLSMIGIFDFIGSLGAGWLSDRYNNARLLAAYYTIRGVSLLFLPLALNVGASSLVLFALVYGLGWVATVPPTSRLCANVFGPEKGSVVFGWTFAAHQIGAAVAALGAGMAHDLTGSYTATFLAVAVFTISAGIMSLGINAKASIQPPVAPTASYS